MQLKVEPHLNRISIITKTKKKHSILDLIIDFFCSWCCQFTKDEQAYFLGRFSYTMRLFSNCEMSRWRASQIYHLLQANSNLREGVRWSVQSVGHECLQEHDGFACVYYKC
jgi:hypothetical protein